MSRLLLALSLLVPSIVFAATSPKEEIVILEAAIDEITSVPNHPHADTFDVMVLAIAERQEFLDTRAKGTSTYVMVNIGSQRLTAVERDKGVNSQKVIVGRDSRKTPIFSDTLRYIVTNPYWNVPVSLAQMDVIPKINADPKLRSYYGYELIDTATNQSVAWQSKPNLRRYRIRQLPSDKNALGLIKFMFDPVPNRAIYLHDTPDKHLFANDSRRYSSGCIRLEDPQAFGRYLMGNKAVPKSSKNDRWLKLATPKVVHIVEWTVYVDENKNIVVNDVTGESFRTLEKIEAQTIAF